MNVRVYAYMFMCVCVDVCKCIRYAWECVSVKTTCLFTCAIGTKYKIKTPYLPVLAVAGYIEMREEVVA